jgi:hypothetical protein
MSAPRRSARIAARNASKPVSMTKPLPAFLKETPSPLSTFRAVEYNIYPNGSDIENPQVLKELIARHEMRYENDLIHASHLYATEWEREMDAMSRWLCIDRRILKASPEMYDKAKTYAHNINYLLPSLYAKQEALADRTMSLSGIESDAANRDLLWCSILRELAHHAHDKWNLVWNECPHEPTFKPEMGWSSDDE